MLTDNTLGIINEIKNAAPINKPYTITEWNHCYPNRYAYETPLIIAFLGVNNNLDGLFQFAFTHNLPIPITFDDIKNYFDIIENPQQLILVSFGSAIFLRTNDTNMELKNGIFTIHSRMIHAMVGFIKNRQLKLGPLTVEAKENGTVALLKEANGYLLVTVGEVRNTDSGWSANGKFNWGKAPILLKNIGVKITSKNKFKIYELDNHGTRTKEVDTTQSRSPWFELLPEN